MDDCDHDGGNQLRQTPVTGEVAPLPANTEELGTITSNINRYGLDADLDNRKADGGRQHEEASTSSDKGQLPHGEAEEESRGAIHRRRRTCGRSIEMEQHRAYSRDGVKAPEGRRPVDSSKSMIRTQQQPMDVDQQANGGAGERTSLLDTLDSWSATQAESSQETKLESEESSQASRKGPSLGIDLVFMVVAASAMIVMSIPEDHHWALWILCCLTVLYVPVQRLRGLPKGGGSGLEDIAEGSVEHAAAAADQAVNPCVLGDIRDVDVDHRSHAEKSAAVSTEKALPDERVRVMEEIEGAAAERRAATDLYRKIEAGLSAVQLAFIGSEGEERKSRLLHQCLTYANGDIAQAKKVCAAFCDFRLAEGWDLVLSAPEMQDLLRSRVHTLTERRDKLGRAMLTFSPGSLDMTGRAPVAYQKMFCYVLQEVLEEPGVAEKGIVLLVDAREMTLGMLRHLKISDYKRGLRMLNGAFPVKVKAIRILHVNRALSVALSTASGFMSAKMKARLETVPSDKAADGSFTRNLADPSNVPIELEIGGTWTGSLEYWNSWVADRVP